MPKLNSIWTIGILVLILAATVAFLLVLKRKLKIQRFKLALDRLSRSVVHVETRKRHNYVQPVVMDLVLPIHRIARLSSAQHKPNTKIVYNPFNRSPTINDNKQSILV
jgi:hypothetical protein